MTIVEHSGTLFSYSVTTDFYSIYIIVIFMLSKSINLVRALYYHYVRTVVPVEDSWLSTTRPRPHREAVSRLLYSAKANQASWVGHSTHTYTHSHSTSSSSSGVQSTLLKEQQ